MFVCPRRCVRCIPPVSETCANDRSTNSPRRPSPCAAVYYGGSILSIPDSDFHHGLLEIKMTSDAADTMPKRGREHDALSVFIGNWKADGTSYGGTDQSGADPKANGVPGPVRTLVVGTPASSS